MNYWWLSHITLDFAKILPLTLKLNNFFFLAKNGLILFQNILLFINCWNTDIYKSPTSWTCHCDPNLFEFTDELVSGHFIQMDSSSRAQLTEELKQVLGQYWIRCSDHNKVILSLWKLKKHHCHTTVSGCCCFLTT